MGILVEGVDPREAIKQVNSGKYDAKIKSEKTELTAEEIKTLEEERIRLAAEAEKRHAQEEAAANQIMKEMEGKATSLIKAKMIEVGISKTVMDKLLGLGKAAAAPGAAPGAKPAATAPAAAPAKK